MYRLRAATPADVDFLVDVVLLTTTFEPGDPAFRARYAEWTPQLIADAGAPSTTYVIEVAGRPAGRLRVEETAKELVMHRGAGQGAALPQRRRLR